MMKDSKQKIQQVSESRKRVGKKRKLVNNDDCHHDSDRLETQKELEYFKHLCRSIGFHKEIVKVSKRAKKLKKEQPSFVHKFYASAAEGESMLKEDD